MIYSVSTSAELVLAAKHASGGDTIQLAPGSYSAVTLKNLNFSTPVTITSADPGNPAVLSDFTVTSVNGLNIENVDVKVGEKMGMIVEKSSNIIIDHIDVVGASVEKPGGNGLKIDQSIDVVVKNSSFHELGYGLTHVNSERIVITSNTFENIRVDGIRGGGTSHIEISNNTLRNFFRDPGEHGDAIQFWTRSTTASAHDIVIRDNLIERGEGNRMQGIFMGDETKGKLPYVNVEITGNTILGTMYHGINLDSARGAIVSENTVVGYEDMKSWIRVAGSTDVEISRNIATQYTTPTDGNINVVRSDNLTVPQTSDGASYILTHYARLFPTEAPPVLEEAVSDFNVMIGGDFQLHLDGWIIV